MRILVLVDGLHTEEVLDGLARTVTLADADLLLAYVRPVGARRGLDTMSRRPGRRPMPPHRVAEVTAAEEAAGDEALTEAAAMARRHASSIETISLEGEPGREICRLAELRRADLVVVRAGGRDRPPLGPGSLGPTARFVADHCMSAVLLLRRLSTRVT